MVSQYLQVSEPFFFFLAAALKEFKDSLKLVKGLLNLKLFILFLSFLLTDEN